MGACLFLSFSCRTSLDTALCQRDPDRCTLASHSGVLTPEFYGTLLCGQQEQNPSAWGKSYSKSAVTRAGPTTPPHQAEGVRAARWAGLGWAGGLCAQRKPEAGVCEAGVCAAYPRQAPQAAQVLSLLLVGAPRQQQLGQTLTHREAVFCRCNRPLPSRLKHSVQACCSPGAARN